MVRVASVTDRGGGGGRLPTGRSSGGGCIGGAAGHPVVAPRESNPRLLDTRRVVVASGRLRLLSAPARSPQCPCSWLNPRPVARDSVVQGLSWRRGDPAPLPPAPLPSAQIQFLVCVEGPHGGGLSSLSHPHCDGCAGQPRGVTLGPALTRSRSTASGGV